MAVNGAASVANDGQPGFRAQVGYEFSLMNSDTPPEDRVLRFRVAEMTGSGNGVGFSEEFRGAPDRGGIFR